MVKEIYGIWILNGPFSYPFFTLSPQNPNPNSFPISSPLRHFEKKKKGRKKRNSELEILVRKIVGREHWVLTKCREEGIHLNQKKKKPLNLFGSILSLFRFVLFVVVPGVAFSGGGVVPCLSRPSLASRKKVTPPPLVTFYPDSKRYVINLILLGFSAPVLFSFLYIFFLLQHYWTEVGLFEYKLSDSFSSLRGLLTGHHLIVSLS